MTAKSPDQKTVRKTTRKPRARPKIAGRESAAAKILRKAAGPKKGVKRYRKLACDPFLGAKETT